VRWNTADARDVRVLATPALGLDLRLRPP
jgi:hypothetical protein